MVKYLIYCIKNVAKVTNNNNPQSWCWTMKKWMFEFSFVIPKIIIWIKVIRKLMLLKSEKQ